MASQDNGVPKQTVRGWLRDEEKLRDFVDLVDSTDRMKRKKAKNCVRDPELDKVVCRWFVKERQPSTPSNGTGLSIQVQNLRNHLQRVKDLKTNKSYRFLQKVNA